MAIYATLGWIIFVYSFSLFITLYLFLYTWLRRKVSIGAGPFALVLLVEAVWIFGNICELLAPTLAQKLFWDNVQWPATLVSGPAVLWFALAYTHVPVGRIRRMMAWAGGLSALVILVLFAPMAAAGTRPGAHMETRNGFDSLMYPFLPSDYLAMAFQYLLVVAALAYIVRWSLPQPYLYRRRAALVLGGFLIPLMGTAWGIFNTSVGPQRDLSPAMFALGNLMVAWALFRLQLFNVMQAARERAVNHMQDALVVLDSEDRISDLNPAAQALFGCTTSEALDRHASEVLPRWLRLERYSHQQESQDEISIAQPGEESPRVYDLALLPVTDQLGRVSARILVLHNITTRKRNEAILRQVHEERVRRRSEEKFHTIIEQIGEGFALMNTEGRVVEWNYAMEQISGIPRHEAIGRFHWDLMELTTLPERRTPEWMARYRQMVLNQTQAGQQGGPALMRSEVQIQALDGTRKYIQQAPFPIKIGSETWIASFIRDITGQKLAQLSLERFAARMQILHGIDQAILSANSMVDLCQTALRELQRLVPYCQAGLGLVDGRQAEHTWLVQHGEAHEGCPVRNDLAAWVEHFESNSEARELADGNERVRVVALRCQDKLIGVLYLGMAEQAVFSEEMSEIVRDLSAQLAVAIQHAVLLEQTQRRVQELTGLHELATELNRLVHSPQALGGLAEKIAGLTGARRAAILLYDAASQRVRVTPPAYGFDPAEAKRLESPAPAGVGKYRMWAEGWVYLSSPEQEHPLQNWLKNRLEYENLLAAPLLFEGNLYGGMLLVDKPGGFNPEDFHLLTVIASQAAAVTLNIRLYEELAIAYEATIAGWSKALELRDKETQGHSERVTNLSMRLAERLGVQGEDLQHFKRGVLLHDIGKMGVPDAILLKEGPLTEAEWAVMRQHPCYAAEMLAKIDYLRQAQVVAYSHHERWDGSGYPHGLKGEDIPLWGRLFAVVDVWDALTTDRPYRPAWSEAAALAYLRENAGVLFDPAVVAEFLAMLVEE